MNKIRQLDALRGLAALYVLCHHIASSYLRLQRVWYGQPFRFGQEAVIVFFLLSGFVIRISSGPPSESIAFRPYFIRRFRRIYPIFIASLVLTYLCLIARDKAWPDPNGMQLLGNLAMLQDSGFQRPGINVLPYLGNDPLWSLSYEWWFYLLFVPINNFLGTNTRKYFVFGLSLIGSALAIFVPHHFAYVLAMLLVWWAGVELGGEYMETGTVTLRRQWSMLLMLLIQAGVWLGVCLHALHAHQVLNQMMHPAWELRWFAVTSVFLVFVFLWQKWKSAILDPVWRTFAPLADVSYALYVFHFPILCYLDFTSLLGSRWADILVKVILAFILSYAVEVHAQRWINRATKRFVS